MFELGIVAGVVGLLALVGVAATLPWDHLVTAGLWLAVAGLALGVPTGLAYHVQLFRRLAPRAALPPRWWLRPTAFHAALAKHERPGVMGWFYAGALGFLATVLGLALATVGLARG